MSYTPTTWQTGDVVTAVKLNNMESGISNNDSAITVLQGAVADAEADITAIEDSIADEYSSSSTYEKDAHVMYEGQLYECVSAINTAEAWTPAHWSAVSVDELLSTKAEIDGYYQSMTVGNAEQLVSTVGKTDETPYLFRTTGGSVDVGDRMKLQKVVGGSIAWNQGTPEINSTNWKVLNSNGTLSIADGVLTFSGATAANGNMYCWINEVFRLNHKMLIMADVKANFTGDKLWLLINTNTQQKTVTVPITETNKWVHAAGIVTLDSENPSANKVFRLMDTSATYTGHEFSMKNPVCVNLTLAFGSTIADYLYALESATPGSGIAKLKSWGFFRKPYYAYNAGSMLSVSGLQSHDEVEFNQWDEDYALGFWNANGVWNASTGGYMSSKAAFPVLPNTKYCMTIGKQTSFYVCFYDADKNFISRNQRPYQDGDNGRLFTTPENCYYLNFSTFNGYGTTYLHDICINLHWDGERDGEYAPYVKHSYPLDSSLTLRGIPKLDANNNLYYKGDEYTPDGNVTRPVRESTLGLLTWTYNSTGQYFSAQLPSRKTVSSPETVDIIVAKYGWATLWTAAASELVDAPDKSAYYQRGNIGIIIKDSAYTDAETFVAALTSGNIKAVYEIDTPTTETADPYQETQVCDDFGTEQFVVTEQNGVAIPVGSESYYMINLRAKGEMAPDSPNGDGDYLMRQTDGMNAYVPYVSPIPTAPSEDGTYTLKVTVSGSTVTKTWVAD